jgi:hypothetical protein
MRNWQTFGSQQTPTDRPVLFGGAGANGNGSGKPTLFGKTEDGKEIPIFRRAGALPPISNSNAKNGPTSPLATP